jgi:hypothetical protein
MGGKLGSPFHVRPCLGARKTKVQLLARDVFLTVYRSIDLL